MQSPFEKHRAILLDEDYSAANSLQQFVLSMYNSASTKFEADRLGNYDGHHFAIFVELANSFHLNGENDPAFMQVCRDMWALRKQWGQEHIARVIEHESIAPDDYEEGKQGWVEQKRWLDERTAVCRANGWID